MSDGLTYEVSVDLEEKRRCLAVQYALRMYPQGAGHAQNVIESAKEIETYLKGDSEKPPTQA